jgi:DNA polymerase-3 subunit alpha
MCDVNFGHIHTHSEYSILDGMSKIEELILTAKELGQEFIAITDHGSTSGLFEAQKLGQKHGVKVIHGCEFYYERENDKKNGHLVVFAKNNKGIENMFKLQEYAYVHNYYYKPRINWDILKFYHEGLIVTSSCLGSAFNQMIIEGDIVGATGWARKFKEVFGNDFYIEIQPNQIPEQHVCNLASIKIAKSLGIKIVATNDVHYTYETDCFPHEVLLALQLNKKMSDEKRFKFTTNDFWLKSAEEMLETFDKLDKELVTEALSNTKEIADKCNGEIKIGNYLPQYYDIPNGKTERQLLVERVIEGAREKGKSTDKEYMKMVQEEIDVIDRNGYSGYFLIVQDYVNSSRNNGIIVGDGRGSGAGSKVAYLTDITRIDPQEFDLLFERFMADGRQPDFDVDFSNQDAVFEDLQKKYGMENVARIVAFGTMSPRNVVRKVLNAFEHPQAEIGRITKMIDETCKTLDDAYAAQPELLNVKKKYKEEFDIIARLEGIVSHESQHAGGVIIYPGLSSILPVKTKADDKTKRIVAFDKYMLEELGHYKFDILGLETLPVLRRCLDSIYKSTNQIIDLNKINYEDENIYKMLGTGDVSGVFQLNSQSAKVIEQQPRNFRDLIAINSLIRPGVGDWDEYIARRKGKTWSVHKSRLPYMEETSGTMTYQEQFLLDCKTLAGWDIAYSDKYIRKAKNLSENEELKEKFIQDSLNNNYSKEEIILVWDEICAAVDGGYSFNKSHSASYAMLSYQTAFLKYYYPQHFYASLMTSDGDDSEKIATYIAECKKRGISILPPDINKSTDEFVVEGDAIRYRITTIKHVGESAITHIKELRPIKSFDEFMEKRQKNFIKQNVLVNLVKSGCFDFDNPNRGELLHQVEMANRTSKEIKNNVITFIYNFNDQLKSEWEKQSLGMYLSTHPMEKYGFNPLESYKEDSECLVGGEVVDLSVRNDKKGNQMAFITLDTLFGSVRILVFSSLWSNDKLQSTMEIGKLVMVKGKKSGDSVLLNTAEELK